ncbi:MAG: hypothetical protein IJ678_02810 [Kiritimatiellae bacterium]|nr:hypothetical protein [Kiritimatiellia bacterium]
MHDKTFAAAAAISIMTLCAAAQEAVPEAEPAFKARPYGDVRMRLEAFDDIPIRTEAPAVTRGGYNNYFRFRARAGFKGEWGDLLSFDVRGTDEVRFRNHGQKSYEWPDEAIIDQLKVTFRGLFDGRADVTAGRQDVFLGSGRLFAEGTAKDGSRTTFFDGLRARIRLAEKTTLDVFGFYGGCETDLALGHEHRDLTGLGPGWNGMAEATAGFFFEDRSSDAFGWGAYYVWLRDTAWRTVAGDRVPHEDVHTFGLRAMPRISDVFSAEFEGALQRSGGDFDRRAGFAYGGLKAEAPCGAYVSANALYLTGDDPETGRREDFNVLFGRYPWISELMLYGFDGEGVGTWRNLVQAWLECGGAFGENAAHRVKATVGPVWADERDGAGGGDFRGWLETVFWAFPVCSGRFGDLTGHFFLEVFEPGDYYVSDSTAYFFRVELNLAF